MLAVHTVLLSSIGPMRNGLAGADGDNALRHRLSVYACLRLLVDEEGYVSYSNRHADLLFEIVSRRFEAKSTLITINRPFAEWGEVFPNAACVVFLVDRLAHHAALIPIQGESYRIKQANECSERRLKVPGSSDQSHIRSAPLPGQVPSAGMTTDPESSYPSRNLT